MANADIGLIVCPCCEFPDAHVRETVKRKAYIVCDECHSQSFARGPLSDQRIRSRMRPAAVQPDPAPDVPPATKPAKKKTAAAPAPAPAPEPKNEGFQNWLGI